ncbi:cysteine-rich CWC family protein [Acidovorax sp. DW039]|uniref:cysteine-rich CWC family protein n=1 Tax=Acidovorax sp. DW039 TaxID=3095606 RepID=UPI0030D0052D
MSANDAQAGKCPLCGQANGCAIAAGQPPHTCWCMQASISPEALGRLPPSEQGTRCICPHCARNLPPPASNGA